jgi:hypothetical protein
MLTLREHLGTRPVFSGVHVAHFFSFLCCVFCFVCLRLVSCVPSVASSLDCQLLIVPLVFSNVYLLVQLRFHTVRGYLCHK